MDGRDIPAGGSGRYGLPASDLRRISEAISAAEATTSAEIRVVLQRDPVVQHPFFSIMWASLLALVVPWPVLLLSPMPALQILTLQAGLFVVMVPVMLLPSIAPHMVPKLALKSAARSTALEIFLAHGIPQTPGRSGVLIFAAAREHLIEVVADEGAHTHLGFAAWNAICEEVASRARQGALADGLVAGVEKAGMLLSGPLPRRPDDRNDLPNQVIVL